MKRELHGECEIINNMKDVMRKIGTFAFFAVAFLPRAVYN